MKVDSVVIERVESFAEFKSFIKTLGISDRVFVIKPCWQDAKYYTSAETLEWLLKSLKGKKIVIESYSPRRNEDFLNGEKQKHKRKTIITAENAREKWQWIKRQDIWFLKHSGIGKVLKKFDVEYINVTEEIWSGRVAEVEEIKTLVKSRYAPLINPELYRLVPQKIYNLRGSTLISLNLCSRSEKKGVPRTSAMNILDLIPDPVKSEKWLGKKDQRLTQTLVEINKLYRSIFPTNFWINELAVSKIFVGCSQNSVLADALSALLLGFDPKKIRYLNHLAKVFGGYPTRFLVKAKKIVEKLREEEKTKHEIPPFEVPLCEKCGRIAQYRCAIDGRYICCECARFVPVNIDHIQKREPINVKIKVLNKNRQNPRERSFFEAIETLTSCPPPEMAKLPEEWKPWSGSVYGHKEYRVKTMAVYVNNEYAGFLDFVFTLDSDEVMSIQFWEMSIHPKFQNAGVFSAMIKRLMRIAKKNNVKRLYVSHKNDNLPAIIAHYVLGGKILYVKETHDKLEKGRFGIPRRNEIIFVYDLT